MADVNDLLGQALIPPAAPAPVVPSTAILPDLSESKKQSITAASADKQAQLSTATPYQIAAGGDRGSNSMSEYESDLRYTSPSNLYAKYGDQATQMLANRAEGILDVKQDASVSDRSLSALTYDSLSSGLVGLGSALGGIGALGAGVIDKDAGTAIAKGINDLTEWNQGIQSPELQGRNKIRESKNFLDTRDSAKLSADEISNGSGELISGLKRIGRDVVSSIDNATDDPATFIDGTAQALGSLFAVGPLSKVIGGVGNAVTSNSAKAGLALQAELGGASGAAAKLALAAGESAPVLGAIAGIEGGGAYQQVAADIMGRSHDTLLKESPAYRELIDGGMSQEEAKTTVANRTGMLSASITAPLAAVTGTLVSKFEGSPFAAKNLSQVVGNLLKEPLEEGIQGGTSQLAQNYAESEIANTGKDLTEGVGRQIGEGALYGLGMTAITQAPIGAGRALQAASPFADIVADRAKALASAPKDALIARADALNTANQKASPIADATVAQAAAESMESAPAAAAVVADAIQAVPEDQRPLVQTYADKVMTANNFDAGEVSPSLAPIVDGATNRVDAIQRLAKAVSDAPEGSPEQLRAGLNMYDLMENFSKVLDSDQTAFDALPADHQARGIIQEYDALMSAAMNTPSVRNAMATIAQVKANMAEPAPVNIQDAESVRDAVLTAQVTPDQASLENNEKILYQVEQGNLTVTPEQKAALQASTALLRAAKAADEDAVRLGNNTKAAQVARNVRTENGEKGPSALQHTQGIMAAWKAGNTDLATERLRAFEKLVQNMSNKVGALNTHFAGGDSTATPITYQALAPNGEWFESKTGLSINPAKARSVEFAQTVNGEAKLLADVYNGLTEAFPDLGGKHFDVTSLDSKLDLPVNQVVKNFTTAPVKTPAPVAESTVAAAPAPTTPVKSETPVAVEPEPKVEKALTVETVPEPKVQTEEKPVAPEKEVKPKAAPAEALFGNLSSPIFNQTFKLPAEQHTYTIGSEAPIDFVHSAFKSQASLVQLVGTLNHNFDAPLAKTYQKYVNTAHDLTDIMQQNLDAFMKEKGIAEMGDEAARIVRGKALNIAENVNGEMVYNPELVQAAALAGLQWNLTADNFGSTLDEKDLASILGIDADSVTSAQVELMNQGLSTVEAKRSLAQKIRNYWGVSPDANAQIGNVEGIPESVAAELMRAMQQTGDISVLQLALLDNGNLVAYEGTKPKGTVKQFDRIIPRERDAEDLLNTFPAAIETAVLKTPEDVRYIGKDVKVPVADTQLRNPLVQNTDQQVAAIKNEQKTEYTLNAPMAGLYQAMGVDAMVRLFGAGELKQENMNINHAQSAEGQNRSTIAAFNHLTGLIGEMSNMAEAAGVPLTELPVRYAHNVTRVGRLQMLGKYNPQASKMVREAMLPTWSTLDLSDKSGDDYTRFMLGVAQGLGVKIHNMPAADSIKKTQALLDGPLSEVVQDLAGWVKGYDVNSLGKAQTEMPADLVDKLEAGFKDIGLSFVGLHAVMEYARLQNETGSDFRTALYVEADGMTNGPVNAMALFTPGPFSPEWIRNMGKGGLWFNQPGQNSTIYRSQVDGKDLYQATTDVLKDRMADMRAELANNAPVSEKLNHLENLMDLFLGGDLTLDQDGNLILNRGIAKNPLTITIYGSGAGGIAAKMVKALTDNIYEAMSQVADKKATNFNDIAVAMFGAPASVATEKMQRFVAAYSSLSNSRIKKGKKGLEVQSNPAGRKAGNFDPKTFTFNAEEVKNMQSNMLNLFVTPMRSAIEETVGKPLMDTAQLLRASTQVQSIFLETLFKQEIEAMMASKEKSDPTWKKGDFLTQKELGSIYKKLDVLAPFVETGTQTFFVAGSQSTDLGLTQFGRDFAGKFRSDAFVYGPADAGVAGIPFLNIGAGDAQMMQTAATMVDAPQRNLKIFDGMNMPLDSIYADSEKMNQAVWESWMGNPLDAVKKSFDQFMANANFDTIADAKEALTKALFPPQFWNEDVSVDAIRSAMDDLQTNLAESVDQIQARHNVMAMVDVSVDQMAATASPFGRKGTVQLTGTDPEALAAQLNTLYVQELAKIQQTNKSAETVGPEIEALATKHETGVRLLNSSDLNQLAQVSKLPADQASVLNSITQSLAADGYLVAFGSAAEIAAFQQESGFVAPSNVPAGTISGYTSMGDKVIYLINPSAETLIHELVHAATFDFVNSFYNGDAARLNPQAAAAIERTEVLMEQFLNLPVADILPSAAQAHDNASSVINDYLLSGDKASALNEFMAWALSNRQLQDLTKKTKASKLAQIAQSVWEAIKSMYFRTRTAPSKGTDMFSNLLFNSAMLMRKQPTLAQRSKANVLFMNSIYGNNERVAKVAEAFDKTVVQYLRQPIKSGTKLPSVVHAKAIQNGIDMANMFVAHGFPMTMQENAAFQAIVGALATEAYIDPASMVAAQDLFSHVVKNLSVESFMTDPTDQAQRYYAQEKYNTLTGKYGSKSDLSGRSSMLPAFLALATVNDGFRDILSKMDMPKGERNTDGTLDARLENIGSNMMEKLSSRLAGTTKTTNVQEAIDALHNTIADQVNDRDTLIDQVASKAGGLVDRANEIVVDGITSLAEATHKTASRVAKNASNKVVRVTAELTSAISGLVADTTGEIAAKGLITKANKSSLWTPIHDFVNDLVGRTDSNASIYDMIKGTRSVVQAARQQFRERLPELLGEKFSRTLTDGEWNTLHVGLGKTDIAALLDAKTNAEVSALLSDQAAMTAEIARLEADLSSVDAQNFPLVQAKAKQLANFMNTGVPGRNLLRNAETVAKLFNEKPTRFVAKSQDYVNNLDQLISLYAADSLNQGVKNELAALVSGETEGTDFVMSYLKGQRYDEQAKATGIGRVNAYKGYIPSQSREGVSLIVASDADYADLVGKSYIRVGDYEKSSLDRGDSMGYYFAPVSARGAFQQGIMQNVRQSAGGVDQATGFSSMPTAGRITDTGLVKAITQRLGREQGTNLLPVYDELGRVFAYERSMDPNQLERTQDMNHLGKAIGQWRGRQFEEQIANIFNQSLVDKLYDMHEKDIAESSSNSAQYVDLLNDNLDPVLADAVKLFNPETRSYIESKFGKSFPVRKDMLNDALGYRSATVGDAWTGNSRWSEDTQKAVKGLAMSVFGNDAYKTLVNAEKTLKNIVSDARVLIAVKSVIVPAVNFVSNILQLTARGVPLKTVLKNMPSKTAELDLYMKSRLEQVDLEAELRATQDPAKTRKLEVRVQAIKDANKRLSIWPLLEAGEFSTVADVGMTRSELMLSNGRLQAYMEDAVNKLPGPLATAGRYALVTKDTALFKALQKSVEYGDFLAKSILFDDLTKRQGMTTKDALGRVTEEFVNYDRLPGRFRGTMEQLGLLWFYNFKIRSTKVALSMIRHNPVHTLLATSLPAVVPGLTTFGAPGLPTYDNIAWKAITGTLGGSIGPGQGLRAASLNPWVQLTQ